MSDTSNEWNIIDNCISFYFFCPFAFAEGVEVNLKLIANVVNRDGDDYLDLQKVNVDLKIKKMTVDIKDNLNDNLIMSTVNQVMNDNWREIFDEMKPDFEKFISETYKEVVKPVFDRVPYKNFFSE